MINTYDIDWVRLVSGYLIPSTKTIEDVLRHVMQCPFIQDLKYRDSASGNGYHVKVKCSREGCDLCRLVFDSPIRFDMDLTRDASTRDVLWDEKTYTKHGKHLRLRASSWKNGSTLL